MSRKKILVVDDEESLCRAIKLNLEETEKYEVQTETDACKTLAIAKVFRPDLIILDFLMPKLDGGDVALQLEKNISTKNIPIIFLTAVATNEDTNGYGAVIGGRFIIGKPITTEKLIEAIERNIR